MSRLLRRLVRVLIRLYYPKVIVTGREQIQEIGPVLLVANHANSLIDAVMVGLAAVRPVHFLAKAPLFDIPIFGTVLRALGMLPAFRGSDDPAQLRRNVQTFAGAAAVLQTGGAVGIFPEGKSHDSLKLAMIRSGAARIAVQAVQQGARALQLVPIGVNYENKQKFGAAVWIRIGEPVEVAKIIECFRGDERQALRSLTNEIDRRLKAVVIQLSEERWTCLLPQLEAIFPGPNPADPIAALRQRKRIADAMNYFRAQDEASAGVLAQSISDHYERLAKNGLDFSSPILLERPLHLMLPLVATVLAAVIGFTPALLGTAAHLVPFALVRALSRRCQTEGNTTVSLTRFGLGLPLYFLWYAAAWWGLGYVSGVALATLAVLAMPFAGVLALNYWPWLAGSGWVWWSQFRLLSRRDELARLRAKQGAICRQLKRLRHEYNQAQAGSFPESAARRE